MTTVDPNRALWRVTGKIPDGRMATCHVLAEHGEEAMRLGKECGIAEVETAVLCPEVEAATLEATEAASEDDGIAERNRSVWAALAVAYGWNELAKRVKTLGEKVYCRLARDAAEQVLKELGVTLNTTPPGEVVLTLERACPHVAFYDTDIALMREAVKKYDASHVERATVVGDMLSGTIDDFIRSCEVHLAEEQAKASPDTALVGLLGDAVRMARELGRPRMGPPR
jgi:hypothetical protein